MTIMGTILLIVLLLLMGIEMHGYGRDLFVFNTVSMSKIACIMANQSFKTLKYVTKLPPSTNLQETSAFLMYPKQASLSCYVRYMQKRHLSRVRRQSSIRQCIRSHIVCGKDQLTSAICPSCI
jgi:hypothetical protein